MVDSSTTSARRTAVVVGVALFVGLVPSVTVAQAAFTARWFVTHAALGQNSLAISDERQTVSLSNGWTCSVEPTSQAGWYSARHARCRKGSEEFEFSVQCAVDRPKDHTHIRFRDPAGKMSDLIELACEKR